MRADFVVHRIGRVREPSAPSYSRPWLPKLDQTRLANTSIVCRQRQVVRPRGGDHERIGRIAAHWRHRFETDPRTGRWIAAGGAISRLNYIPERLDRIYLSPHNCGLIHRYAPLRNRKRGKNP